MNDTWLSVLGLTTMALVTLWGIATLVFFWLVINRLPVSDLFAQKKMPRKILAKDIALVLYPLTNMAAIRLIAGKLDQTMDPAVGWQFSALISTGTIIAIVLLFRLYGKLLKRKKTEPETEPKPPAADIKPAEPDQPTTQAPAVPVAQPEPETTDTPNNPQN